MPPRFKYRPLFLPKNFGEDGASQYTLLELPDGSTHRMTSKEKWDPSAWPDGARRFGADNLDLCLRGGQDQDTPLNSTG